MYRINFANYQLSVKNMDIVRDSDMSCYRAPDGVVIEESVGRLGWTNYMHERIYVPRGYSACWQCFKGRCRILHYVLQYLKMTKQSYEMISYFNGRLQLTNSKGKVYACYL